jgi:DNA mismatch repair ATPase MutS
LWPRRKLLKSFEAKYVSPDCDKKLLIYEQVSSHASLLRLNARILDELDVTLAFANLAGEMNFVRPLLKDE